MSTRTVIKAIEDKMGSTGMGNSSYLLKLAATLLALEAIKAVRMWRDYNFGAYDEDQYEEDDEEKEDYE